MSNKRIPFKDYKINEKSPAISLTMEAMDISREEAIEVIRKLNYKVDFPKHRKKKHAA